LEENGKPIAKIIPFATEKSASWDTLFEAIEEKRIETETTDLADQHDHYLLRRKIIYF